MSQTLADTLRNAAAAGDGESVLAALTAGADVNGRAAYGDTALNLAAENGHDGVVAILLGAGANLENKGGADKTPIMNAAFAGHVSLVRLFIARGALNSLAMKVSILKENAESGMVRPEAAQAWQEFLESLIAERRRQDLGEPA
jgi:ankyrin repeat protein